MDFKGKPYLLFVITSLILYGIIFGTEESAAEERRLFDSAVIAQKDGEIFLEFEVPFEEKDSYLPPKQYLDSQGKPNWLKDWHLEPYMIPERRELVERKACYNKVEWKEQIPKYATLTVRDKGTGVEVKKDYSILRMDQNGQRWTSDFAFLAVFHSYDADFYQLGSKKVPFNSQKPELIGCEEELLKKIGVELDSYRILDAAWEGDAYLDQNGDLCRNAVVKGEKKVEDYVVTYGGEVVFPKGEGVKCVAVYRGFDSAFHGWKKAEERSVESWTDSDGENRKRGRWLVTVRSTVITLSILLIGAVILFFMALVKKSRQKRNGEGVEP